MKSFAAVSALLSTFAASAALMPGLNFEQVTVTGTATPSAAVTVSLSNVVTSAVIDQEVTADGSGGFTAVFEGLTRGVEYVAFAGGESLGSVVTANERAWYDENGVTAGENGEGAWVHTPNVTVKREEPSAIAFADGAEIGSGYAAFRTPARQDVRTTVATIDMEFANPDEFDDLPSPNGMAYGFSLANVEDGGATKLQLVVVDDGKWTPVPVDLFAPETSTEYEFVVKVGDSGDTKSVDYFVKKSGALKHLLRSTVSNLKRITGGSYRFVGDGRVYGISGKYYDSKLIDYTADVRDCTFGPDFSYVNGKVDLVVTPLASTDAPVSGYLRVNIIDGRGKTVGSSDFAFSGSGTFDIAFSGLEAGEHYGYTYEIYDEGYTLVEKLGVGNTDTPAALKVPTDWVDEDASTLSGARTGTGRWDFSSEPDPQAEACTLYGTAEWIHIDTFRKDPGSAEKPADFYTATDPVGAMYSSIREFRFRLLHTEPGFFTSRPFAPGMKTSPLGGLTLVQDDLGDGKTHFGVYNPRSGSWDVLADTEAQLGRAYDVSVVVSYPRPGKSTQGSVSYYSFGDDGRRRLLAAYEVKSDLNGFCIVHFNGYGYCRRFGGECYDAHLATDGEKEYWTVAEAIREVGDTGKVISPLFASSSVVDAKSGRFGIKDPGSKIDLVWPVGYVVEETPDGDVRYYVFHLSDYWTDYAKEEDAVAVPNGWEVRSANGLAWLVRKSEEGALVGDITLTADITNFQEHVWIPVREFCGTFDGQNHRLGGLTDKGEDICRTNGLDMTVYGLVGTAVDSTFRNLAFEDVAISNSADAVASMLGCSVGGLTLTNVVVRSGSVTGGGRFVSGIVGYIGDFGNVDVRGVVNAADVVATEAGANASGIANLGGSEGGAVKVVGNENRGSIAAVVGPYDGGGNVAQVLAGSDADAEFAAVEVAGNVGTGDVERVSCEVWDGQQIGSLPIVNLGSELARKNGDYDFRRFVEADGAVRPIDPYRKTARMSGAAYLNGVPNFAGEINDMIESSMPGEVITLVGSGEAWSPVILDRAITLDLNGNVIDNVFEGYTFEVSAGAGATVKNGTVTYPGEKLATRAANGTDWTSQNLATVSWNDDYWDRGIFVGGEFIDTLLALPLALRPEASVSVPEDSGYSVNVKTSTIDYRGKPAYSLAPLGCRFVDNGDGTYVVVLDEDDEAPAIDLALAPNGGASKVTIKGAKKGCTYSLQSVASLAESFKTVSQKTAEKDGETIEFTVDTSAESGFYRIITE